MAISDIQQQTLIAVREGCETASDVADKLGWQTGRASNALSKLCADGRIKHTGKRRFEKTYGPMHVRKYSGPDRRPVTLASTVPGNSMQESNKANVSVLREPWL